MSNVRTGIYPGTFDPVTNGHLDIVLRAAKTLDRLIIAVAVNAGKGPLFNLEERCLMVTEQLPAISEKAGIPIEVKPFNTLLMDFAIQQEANIIIRGLRAVSDFEYEFQMAGMNARLNPAVETVFLMASERCQFISSRFVKEIGRLGGNISQFVPAQVEEKLQIRFKEIAENR